MLQTVYFRVGNKARKMAYDAEMETLKEEIENCEGGLVVHADGKKFNEFGDVVERYPILLSGFDGGKTHIISVPKIEDSKGSTQSNTINGALESVNAKCKICGACADTTSSVTGEQNGMFVLLEKLLGRPLLKSYCRLHAVDLLEKAAFKFIFGATKSPAKGEFKSFRTKWRKIDRAAVPPLRINYDDDFMKEALDELRESCYYVLRDPKARSDRRELAELMLHIHGFPLPSKTMTLSLLQAFEGGVHASSF